jgi:hypothetical protein
MIAVAGPVRAAPAMAVVLDRPARSGAGQDSGIGVGAETPSEARA